MKKVMTIILVGVMAVFVLATMGFAAEWYVVKHKSGETAVLDEKPGPGWSVVSGPYKTKAEAARAGGIEPGEADVKPVGEVDEGEASGKWYVAKHKSGKTVVTQKSEPGPGWTVTGGPFMSKAEAARSAGIEPGEGDLEPVGAGADMEEGKWYAVKHKSGEMAIVDYKPGVAWSVVGGPYESKEAAARAHQIDPTKSTMTPSKAGK
jgi:hypothetical protein